MDGSGAGRVTSNGPEGPVTVPGDSDFTAVLPSSSSVATDVDATSADAAVTDGPPRTTSKGGRKNTWRVAVEWIVLIGVALLIAFVIKSFLFQAFYIPSASMEPTLNIGDRVLVNKLSYDFHDVNRGDIVVFEAPPLARSGDIEDLVKRVIGLPGDTVTGGANGGVLVNGHRLKEPYLLAGTQTRFNDVPPGCKPPADGTPGCLVPKAHVFVLGDNREASKDARVFGPIQESSIIGRVFVRIWPLDNLGTL
jgi:signal peptidase I